MDDLRGADYGARVTLDRLLHDSYRWADENAALVFLTALLVPLLGTVAAWVGKQGKTDADGRFVASAVVGLALLLVVAEVCAVVVARSVLGLEVLEANALLLVAPAASLGVATMGIRRVFPLNELGSVRTAADLSLLGALLVAIGWVLSRFHFGALFVGSIVHLAVIAAAVAFVVVRLVRRIRGGARPEAV